MPRPRGGGGSLCGLQALSARRSPRDPRRASAGQGRPLGEKAELSEEIALLEGNAAVLEGKIGGLESQLSELEAAKAALAADCRSAGLSPRGGARGTPGARAQVPTRRGAAAGRARGTHSGDRPSWPPAAPTPPPLSRRAALWPARALTHLSSSNFFRNKFLSK